MHVQRVGLAVTVMLLLLAPLASARTRPQFGDWTVVERSELIVVGRIKPGSITTVNHEPDDGTNISRSRHHTAKLVISETLKGTAEGTEIPVILHYGLDPLGSMGFGPDAVTIMDTGGAFSTPLSNAEKDNLWFLRRRGGIFGGEPSTGAGGRFRFGPLRSGTYSLTVETREVRRNATSAVPSVALGPEQHVSDVRIVVGAAAGGAVEGTVRLGGKLLARQQVSVTALDATGNGSSAWSDADGRYRIEGLGAGLASVYTRRSAHEATGDTTRELRRKVVVENGRTTPLDLDLGPGTAAIGGYGLHGTVPVRGLYIRLTRKDPGDPQISLTTMTETDETGRFDVGGLVAGDYELRALLPNRANQTVAEIRATVALGEREHAEMNLSVWKTLVEGQMTGLEAGEQVWAFMVPGEVSPEHSTWESLALLRDEAGWTLGTNVGNPGDFAIRGLEPGRYTVIATAVPGGAMPDDEVSIVAMPLDVSEGEPLSVEVALPE